MSAAKRLEEQLSALESIAGEHEVKVCYQPMAGLVQGVGGLCRVKGEYRIIVDRRMHAPERLQIVADALRRLDVKRAGLGHQVDAVLAG